MRVSFITKSPVHLTRSWRELTKSPSLKNDRLKTAPIFFFFLEETIILGRTMAPPIVGNVCLNRHHLLAGAHLSTNANYPTLLNVASLLYEPMMVIVF